MNDDSLSLEVEFTQTITLHPPSYIDDPVKAQNWLETDPREILWDALDVKHGEVNILEINE